MKKVWGVMLLLMGLAMFVTIPSKARQIQEIRDLSTGTVLMIKFCLYTVSIFLMGGGVQKLKGKTKEDS